LRLALTKIANDLLNGFHALIMHICMSKAIKNA
jgi:hypothetical protein